MYQDYRTMPKDVDNQTKIINIRCSDEFKNDVRKLARKHNLSMSSYIKLIVSAGINHNSGAFVSIQNE